MVSKKNWNLVAILLSLLFMINGCSAINTQDEKRGEDSTSPLFFLNSILTVDIRDDKVDKTKIEDRISQRVQQIEEEMSLHSKNSEVAAINLSAGDQPVKVSEDVFTVVQSAQHFSEVSQGAFDITVGDLVQLWGIGTEQEKIPTTDQIKESLDLVNYKEVELNEGERTVYLKHKGMVMDLGAIAKGYAADAIREILVEHQVTSAVINLGGNVYVHGSKQGEPFNVGIQNPDGQNGSFIGIYQAMDQSIVTSGVYERYFEQDGKRYHHILSTKDGYPVDNGLVSVTIISRESMDGDALSTSAFALGLQKGMELVETLENVEGIFITDKNEIYRSSGAVEKFQLTDKGFVLK